MTTQYKNYLVMRQKASMLIFSALFSVALVMTAADAFVSDLSGQFGEIQTTQLQR